MTDQPGDARTEVWVKKLDDIDREIARLATICNVRIPDAGRDRARASQRRVGLRLEESGGFRQAAHDADDALFPPAVYRAQQPQAYALALRADGEAHIISQRKVRSN